VTAKTRGLPLPHGERPERGDASRNRRLLLDTARRLIVEHGADAVTMDDLARSAGVGKGTVFRRFGNRAGLMMELLDDDERASQQAFMFGPAPLGPAAPPLERLVAFGRERICFAHTHRTLLSAANRDPRTRHNAVAAVLRTHVRLLLQSAGTTGDVDVQADALLALLDADYIEHRVDVGGLTLEQLCAGWESLARKLCGR
jgi:AcrR family transcriptional regulator